MENLENELLNGNGEFIDTKRSDKYDIPVGNIKVAKDFNARNFTTERSIAHVNNLAESILARGIITPLLVRRGAQIPLPEGYGGKSKDEYEWIIVDGESRFRAIKKLIAENRTSSLGIPASELFKRIPAIVVPKGSNEANWLLDMVTANESLRLEPIELANMYYRLTRMGWTVEEIAEKMGKSVAHVNSCLGLLEYGEDIKQAIVEKKITANKVRLVEKSIKDNPSLVNNGKTKIEVAEERLRNFIAVQSKLVKEGKKAKIGDFIPKKENEKRSEKEILSEALNIVLGAIPEQPTYTRKQFEELRDMCEAGHTVKNAINEAFGVKIAKTGTED